jgi:hypothetical protein
MSYEKTFDGSAFHLSLRTGTDAYKFVAMVTDLSRSKSMAGRNVSSRDECGIEVELPTRATIGISGTAHIVHESTELSAIDVEQFMDDRAIVDFKITPVDCEGEEIVGAFEETGSGWFETFDKNYSDADTANYSFAIKVTTKTTLTEIEE